MKLFHPHRFIGCLAGSLLMMVCYPFTGFAADFLLEWDPNSESDLQGYYVYYQEASSVAADPASATKVQIPLDAQGFDKNSPNRTLSGLKDDTLYFFAVSAYNAAGESHLSDEVSLSKNSSGSGSSNTGSSGDSGSSGGCFISAVQ